MALLYGRTGRLKAKNDVFRPGQDRAHARLRRMQPEPEPEGGEALGRAQAAVGTRARATGGPAGSIDPPGRLPTHLFRVS